MLAGRGISLADFTVMTVGCLGERSAWRIVFELDEVCEAREPCGTPMEILVPSFVWMTGPASALLTTVGDERREWSEVGGRVFTRVRGDESMGMVRITELLVGREPFLTRAS